MPPFRPLAERFWEKVRKTDGCWLWTAHAFPGGYGAIQVGRVSRGAHRVAWELTRGPIPNGMEVCHKCDNPPCVNPDHLFLGTHLDNTRDRDAKRRNVNPFGESHGKATVSDNTVRAIRNEYIPRKVSQRFLAAKYGLSQAHVWDILHCHVRIQESG